MGTCASTVDLFGLAFKSRQKTSRHAGMVEATRGGRKRGVRLACTTMGLPYPPTLVNITELWNGIDGNALRMKNKDDVRSDEVESGASQLKQRTEHPNHDHGYPEWRLYGTTHDNVKNHM
jgi:hypothetical protein